MGAELDWLLTLNGEPAKDVQFIYMRDLFGGQPAQGQLMCAGPASVNRMGTIGTAAGLILLYEDMGRTDKANALREQCAASWRDHMPLYWPPYYHQSCKTLLQSTFGING
jgi:hypothetical protein